MPLNYVEKKLKKNKGKYEEIYKFLLSVGAKNDWKKDLEKNN